MTPTELYGKVLANRWVFERLRPFVTGGIDMSPAYRELASDEQSIVLDVGSGMGDALEHLDAFASYLGIDTDRGAIAIARERHGDRPNVRFESRALSRDDLEAYRPTHVVMVGLLHHLTDDQALDLLQRLANSTSVVCVVTLDIVFLRGRWFNNLLARLDRGRHCRDASGYRALAERAGLSVLSHHCVPCHPTRGRVDYLVMKLAPLGRSPASLHG